MLLDAQLRNHSLATARIPHVPDTLVYALGLDSVRTAADFVDVVLDEARTGSRTAGASLVLADGRRVGSGGLGAEQARQLLRWRRTLESKYTFAQPAGLADDASAAIRQSYAGRRKAVEAEQARLRATARGEVDALRERLRRRLDVMGGEVRTVQRGAAGTRLRLDREVAGARKQAAEAEWRRAAAERELDSYAGLTFAAFVRAVARLTAVGDEPLN